MQASTREEKCVQSSPLEEDFKTPSPEGILTVSFDGDGLCLLGDGGVVSFLSVEGSSSSADGSMENKNSTFS